MAKIDDVAKLAGVSTATVSAVINQQDVVKPKTRTKVLWAIEKLNYHRTSARGVWREENRQHWASSSPI